jgi:hypothetical protein
VLFYGESEDVLEERLGVLLAAIEAYEEG